MTLTVTEMLVEMLGATLLADLPTDKARKLAAQLLDEVRAHHEVVAETVVIPALVVVSARKPKPVRVR